MHSVQLASIAQLGERQTEDLKVPSSILGRGSIFSATTDYDTVGKIDFCTSEKSRAMSLWHFTL